MSQNVTENHEMSHRAARLSAKQCQAAQWLADQHEVKNIARWLKIRRETVARWKRRPEFQAEYERCIEANRKAAEEQENARLAACEKMRANVHLEISDLMNRAIRTITCQFENSHDYLADRSKLAFDVLKFLKADRLWDQEENK